VPIKNQLLRSPSGSAHVLLPLAVVLIRRCVWHRQIRGYAVIHGIASWRGRSITFTDGVCRQCAQRVRREWQVLQSRPEIGPSAWTLGLRWAATVVVGLSAVAATIMASQPTRTLRSAQPVGDRPAAQAVATAVSVGVPEMPRTAAQRRPADAKPVKQVATRRPVAPVADRNDPIVTAPPQFANLNARKAANLAAYRPLAKLELAQALADHQSPRFVAVRASAASDPFFAHLAPLEAELSQAMVQRASARLLLAMQDVKPTHAGTTVQTP
jgi:hypothetical protein